MSQFFLCLTPLCDVFDRPLVIEQPTLSISNSAAILRNPNGGSVFAMHLRLKRSNDVVLLHQTDKLFTAVFLDVKAAADIRKALYQFFRGSISINSRQSRVGHQISSVGGGLKDALH